MTKTIDALVEALEAEKAMRLYGQSPECGKEHWESIRERRRAVYEATDAALAQARAEQAEPVQAATAWMYTSKLAGHQVFLTRYASDLTTYKADKVTPLYRTPPAAPVAKLEPLTDEELRPMCGQSWIFETVKQWARAIEAAHNAKLSK